MSKFSKRVLSEIDRRQVEPRSAAYFLAKRSVFWGLAGLSVLLGGIAVALGIFSVTDYLQTGGMQFDQMPFDDFALGVPLIAGILFALFMASAVLGYRKTPRGYRLQALEVAAIAIALSLGLGLLLHTVKAGQATHGFLSEHFPGYKSYTTIPYAEWSRPEQGYLGGEALSLEPPKVLQLRDFMGEVWIVDVSEADILFSGSPVEEGDVAIRGEQTGPLRFKARTIAPFD